MKIGNFFRTACKAMALAVVAFPMFVSCYDDKALIEDMENMKSDISALEERVAKIEKDLNDQVSGLQTLIGNVEKSLKFSVEQLGGKVDGNYDSLSDMIAALDKKYGDFASTFQTTLQGLVTVKDVKTNADGSVTVTLSDMTQFVVYPKHVDPYKNVVTTIVIDGVIYWAKYVDGNIEPFTDAEGNNIPVGDGLVTPEFKVEEGYIWISFDGGDNWDKTGVADSDATIFSGYKINYTEVDPNAPWIDPEPKTVTLTLADGTTVTLAVDGYAALEFNYEALWVAPGTTNSTPVYINGITNYITQVTPGWTLKEVEDDRLYDLVFKVTAPSAELIETGAAPAEGVIKVLGVAEGGKSVSASLKVTTQPYATFLYKDNAFTIVPNGGLSQYIYGVCKLDEFDPDAIYAGVKAYWDAIKDEDWSARLPEGASRGYGENETPAEDLLGSELEPGVKYIMWTLPCVYETYIVVGYDGEEYEEGTYTVYENSFVNKEFMLQEIKCETNKLSFNELDVTVTVNGIDQYFAGFVTLQAQPEEELVYIVENLNQMVFYGYAWPMDNPGEPYTGSPWGFIDDYGEILPGTNYMLYIIPYVEGKTEYSIEDVKYWEWTTDPLISGGSINVVPGEATATYNSISVPLTADGASMVYWKFVEPKYVSANTVEGLIESGTIFAGSEGEASAYNLSAGTTMTLLAVAVDADGCYGEMLVKEYSTNSLSYNDITIDLELLSTTDTTAIVKVTPSSETATLKYYYAEQDYYMWNYQFGTDKAAISEACQVNSTAKRNLKNMTLTDGTFTMTGLNVGNSYRLAVVAVETDGTYSMAEVLEFDIKMYLGEEFVRAVDPMTGEANPLWEAAKPNIHDVTVETSEFVIVNWDIDVPEGYTVAKSVCYDPEYLASIVSPEDKVRHLLGVSSWYGEYIETDVFDEPMPDPYWASQGGVPGALIYVVIKDAEGNYYEPFTYDPKITSSGGFGV